MPKPESIVQCAILSGNSSLVVDTERLTRPWAQVISALELGPPFATLAMRNMQIDFHALNHLAHTLSHCAGNCRGLRALTLYNNGLRAPDVSTLAAFLHRVPWIRAISIQSNWLGDTGAQELAKHLRRTLSELALIDAGVGPDGIRTLLAGAIAGAGFRE